MDDDPRPRILCVDDERNVLEGLARTLRSLFQVETAVGGKQGLEYVNTKGPFIIVISDLRMPGMTGIEFLSRVRSLSPASVRVLLTGQANVEAAIGAVNEGNIFRFLTKPCPTGVLVKSLMDCLEQYRLVTSERVLLEQTLRGSVKTLTDILALRNPAAFGRAMRAQQSVSAMMARCDVVERWPVEMAAMLSQIGYVTLPVETQEKVYNGGPLTADEETMVLRIPSIVEQLLANIPRLEPVRERLRLYTRPFAGQVAADTFGESKAGANSSAGPAGEEIPWGARALRIALDYDILESRESLPGRCFDIMRERRGLYDPAILAVFQESQGRVKGDARVQLLKLGEVVAGMNFGEDVKSSKGLLLISRGQEVTAALLGHVRNYSSELGIREPIRMIVRESASEEIKAAPAIV